MQSSPSNPVASTKPRRVPRSLIGAIILVVLVVALMVPQLQQAWKQTKLREATLPELEQMAQKDSTNPQVLSLLALRLANAGEYRVAAETFVKAASAGEQDPLIWLAWSASEAAGGSAQRAGVVLNYGIQHVPAIAPQMKEALTRGAALGKNPAPSALADAVCPGGVKPILEGHTKGSFLNGVALWQGRRDPQTSGVATRERLLKENPNNPLYQRLWGEALLANRLYVEAQKVLQNAIDSDPKSPEAHYSLGKALEGQGSLSQAGIQYVAALKLRPDWFPALLAMGHVAVEKQLIAMGIDAFERATKQNPNSADAWVGYGHAYYNQRLRLDKALTGFEKAHQLDPQRTDFFGDYSNALRANFRMEEAETILRQRVTTAPSDARSRYLYALLLLDFKPTPEREAEAEQQLRESLKIEPNVASALTRLARILVSRGNYREAVSLLENALQLDRLNVNTTLTLARAYTLIGRKQDAEKLQQSVQGLSAYVQRSAYLEDQINRKPTDLQLHLDAAKHYEQGGEEDKAQKHLQMAYMLQNHTKEAVKGLNALRDATAVSRPPSH